MDKQNICKKFQATFNENISNLGSFNQYWMAIYTTCLPFYNMARLHSSLSEGHIKYSAEPSIIKVDAKKVEQSRSRQQSFSVIHPSRCPVVGGDKCMYEFPTACTLITAEQWKWQQKMKHQYDLGSIFSSFNFPNNRLHYTAPLNSKYIQCSIDFNISLMYAEILWRLFYIKVLIFNIRFSYITPVQLTSRF